MDHKFDGDKIIVYMNPGQLMELTDLTVSFAALARIYERHYRKNGEEAPRLYITKLESGSVLAEIAPMAPLMVNAVTAMNYSLIVSDFTRRLGDALNAFAQKRPVDKSVGRDEASDLAQFVKPLTGRTGATLRIQHAKFEQTRGDDTTLVEYKFDDAELNRAAVNIDAALNAPTKEQEEHRERIRQEVALIIRRAGSGPGKDKGRTDDRGIVQEVSAKVLPVYFRKSAQSLKHQMMKGDKNPLTHTFIVDVSVQFDGADEPIGYIVTDVHDAWEREDEDE